jgi:hypothetical protein
MHAIDASSPCLVAGPDPVDEGLIALESDGVTHMDYRIQDYDYRTTCLTLVRCLA